MIDGADTEVVPSGGNGPTEAIAFTAEERLILEGLQTIRQAPGTVYSRQLYGILGLAVTETHPSAEADAEVVSMLNKWFSAPLILIEETSNRTLPGMLELVTAIPYRSYLDMLLSLVATETPTLHPLDADLVGWTSEGEAQVELAYPALASPGTPTVSARHEWLEAVEEKYTQLVAAGSRTMPAVDAARLRQIVKRTGDVLDIDVTGCYVEDVDIAAFAASVADSDEHVAVRLHARGAVFGGLRADFGRVEYKAVDLSWSVFAVEEVSFAHATFACAEADDTICLRDATFCPNVKTVAFDEARVEGATRAITLEDAVFSGSRVRFNSMDFGSAELYCYQAQFLQGTRVEFVESSMADSWVTFLGATVGDPKSDDGHGAVVFYRVAPMPSADFAFRHADELRLDNCLLDAPLRFWGIRRLSLWGSVVSGSPLNIIPREADAVRRGIVGRMNIIPREAGAVRQGIVGRKHWFLDALENGRRASRSDLAAEFAIVKEVFHGMGEYDLEDEAFVRHMRFKGRSRASRLSYWLLDVIGRFGTSPMRTLAWLGIALLFWITVDAVWMVSDAHSFTGSEGNVPANALIVAAWSLAQGRGAVVPNSAATEVLLVIQSLSGWFFLGYLFASFVRRTLR